MLVRAMTLNTKVSNDPNAVRDFISSMRHKSPALVIGLQELDINAKRSNFINVPKHVAACAPFYFAQTVAFASDSVAPKPYTDTSKDPWLYGIGIVSSLPIVNALRIDLGPDEKVFWETSKEKGEPVWEHEPRAAILAEIQCGKRTAWFINTHLAHKSDRSVHSPQRAQQIEKLMQAVKQIIPPFMPVLMMGDFNATPDNPDIAVLRDQFTLANPNTPTYINPKKNVSAEIDYFLHKNIDSIGPARAIPVRFSDHKTVCVELSI